MSNIKIAPSILSADYMAMGDAIKKLEEKFEKKILLIFSRKY